MKHLPAYQQMPTGIMEVLQLFHFHKLRYILFKGEHIFEGQNKNLDILFETDEEYQEAARLLEQQGLVLRFSEKFERYKMMYCGFVSETFHSFHLHREIAWHGMKALDKEEVFRRKKILAPGIIVPGIEDSILIHAGHVLFENGAVRERELVYLRKFGEPGIDRQYIHRQLNKNHWNYGFQKVLEKALDKKKEDPSLATIKQFLIWSGKLGREPTTGAYVIWKALRKIFRPLDPRRKGCCLALIGVNGGGKTTLAKKTLEEYQEITQHLGKQQQYYYFGWHPEFPLTKLLSTINQKIKAVSFKEANLPPAESRYHQPPAESRYPQPPAEPRYHQPPRNYSLTQEFIFLYSWLEYLYRYCKNIYPSLRRGNLVITDRYFYDLYGQSIDGKNSLVLKLTLKLFPRPTSTFILDADTAVLQQREKTDKNNQDKNNFNEITKTKRAVFPATYLQTQRENYFFLAQQYNFPIIDTNTNNNIKDCCKTIIHQSWRKLV